MGPLGKRPWLLFLLAALALAALYLSSSLAQTGRLAAPLDDSYIHFQYGKRMAEGAPFVYSPGGAYASGSTAPVWSTLMALGWLVGFRGDAILLWAVLLGALALGAAAASARRAVLALTGSEAAGWLAGGLLVTNGPFLWGAFSGMEVALYALCIALALEMAARRGLGWWATVGAATLAAAVRPEGTVVAAGMALVDLWRRGREGGPRLVLGAGRWAVPLAVGLLPAALNKLLTGSASSASMMAKFNPRFTQLEEYEPAAFLYDMVRQVFGGEFAGPAGMLLVLAFVGGAAVLLRERKAAAAALLVGGLALPLLVYAVIFPLRWHHDRYLMPYLVAFLCVAAVGIVAAEDLVARISGQPAVRALSFAALALSALGALRWAGIYGGDASDIGKQQVVVGEWARDALSDGETLAVNDCGAIAYASGHPVLDLEGIVSPGVLPWAHQGEGSIFEMLDRSGAPRVFALFPNWFPTLTRSPFLTEVGRASLETVHISGGQHMAIYAARGDLLGRGSAVRGLAGGRVVDELDVADVESEAAHGWEGDGTSLFLRRNNRVVWSSEPEPDGRTLIEGARRVSRESFTLTPERPGSARLVVRRSPGEKINARALIDGRSFELDLGAPDGIMGDTSIALGELAGPTRITIENVGDGPQAPRRWSSHVWLVQ